MTGFRELLRTQALVFLRNRAALFFTVIFPLVFVLIFGFVWGGGDGPRATRLGLAVLAETEAELLAQVLADQGGVVTRYADRAALEADLAGRRLDLGLVWDGEALLFLQDPTRVQESLALAEVARGISTQFDLRRQGLSAVVGAERANVGRSVATGWFNMLVPGVMAFSILTAGLLAVSGRITQMKERKQLDRFLVTPMSPAALLAAIAGVSLVVGYVTTLTTLGAAVALFRVRFEVNWLFFTTFVVAATLGSMSLGTLIALVVRRPGSANTVANIVAQVMVFLSGVYFPVEIMPSFLRAVSRALPLTYMAEAMRYVTGVADMPIGRFAAITSVLFLAGAGLFPVLGRYVVTVGRR
jgi:ABC-2 type transport system permease protein